MLRGLQKGWHLMKQILLIFVGVTVTNSLSAFEKFSVNNLLSNSIQQVSAFTKTCSGSGLLTGFILSQENHRTWRFSRFSKTCFEYLFNCTVKEQTHCSCYILIHVKLIYWIFFLTFSERIRQWAFECLDCTDETTSYRLSTWVLILILLILINRIHHFASVISEKSWIILKVKTPTDSYWNLT